MCVASDFSSTELVLSIKSMTKTLNDGPSRHFTNLKEALKE